MPYKLLYADDLVLIAESEELLVEKIERWRKGLEAGGPDHEKAILDIF